MVFVLRKFSVIDVGVLSETINNFIKFNQTLIGIRTVWPQIRDNLPNPRKSPALVDGNHSSPHRVRKFPSTSPCASIIYCSDTGVCIHLPISSLFKSESPALNAESICFWHSWITKTSVSRVVSVIVGGWANDAGLVLLKHHVRFSGHSHRMLRPKKVQCHSPTLSLSLSGEVAIRLDVGLEMKTMLLYGAWRFSTLNKIININCKKRKTKIPQLCLVTEKTIIQYRNIAS